MIHDSPDGFRTLARLAQMRDGLYFCEPLIFRPKSPAGLCVTIHSTTHTQQYTQIFLRENLCTAIRATFADYHSRNNLPIMADKGPSLCPPQSIIPLTTSSRPRRSLSRADRKQLVSCPVLQERYQGGRAFFVLTSWLSWDRL